jgi:hypothetical protein
MGLWSIGPIRGQFQPESFVETQKTIIEDIKIFGNVSILLVKGWDPREVTFSFVVDGMCDPVEGTDTWARFKTDQAGGGPGPRAADPEAVWDEIQRMQRVSGTSPIPVFVTIPGWATGRTDSNVTDNRFIRPRRAIISDSSINRTHIRGADSRAVRAIITVTLREANRPIGTGLRAVVEAEKLQAAEEAAAERAKNQAETEIEREAG